MNKKIKIAISVASIYLILALISILISPRIFDVSGRQGSGMIDGAPILVQVFLLIMIFASLVGAYLVPLVLGMLLPHNAMRFLCNPGEFPSCSASFGIFAIILFNTILYFLVSYSIAGIFLKSAETTTLKSRTNGYAAIVGVIILAYIILKMIL